MKHKCENCLEAVVAAMVSAFGNQNLTTVLPRYKTATERALRLRFGIVKLSYLVAGLGAEVKAVKPDGVPELSGRLLKHLSEFLGSEAYSYMRPLDRKELVGFRLAFAKAEKEGLSPLAFRQQVDGFDKFLDVSRSVNRRDELVHYDRRTLQKALALLEAGEPLGRVIPRLRGVYGRDRRLDHWLFMASRRMGHPVDAWKTLISELLLHLR